MFLYENLRTSTVKSALLILIPKYLLYALKLQEDMQTKTAVGAGTMTHNNKNFMYLCYFYNIYC
jgi:hypothetical protein